MQVCNARIVRIAPRYVDHHYPFEKELRAYATMKWVNIILYPYQPLSLMFERGRLFDAGRLFGGNVVPGQHAHPMVGISLDMSFYHLLDGIRQSSTASLSDLAYSMGAREPQLFFQYDKSNDTSSNT
jgi:hypothetical protein